MSRTFKPYHSTDKHRIGLLPVGSLISIYQSEEVVYMTLPARSAPTKGSRTTAVLNLDTLIIDMLANDSYVYIRPGSWTVTQGEK